MMKIAIAIAIQGLSLSLPLLLSAFILFHVIWFEEEKQKKKGSLKVDLKEVILSLTSQEK
jgi:hypothetical protein